MKQAYYVSLAAVLALAACNTTTEMDAPADGGSKTLTIHAVRDAATKTSYAEDKTFAWSAGDQVSVLCNDESGHSWETFTAQKAAAVSTLTARVSGATKPGSTGGKKPALYPASASHVYTDDSSISYHIPATRDFRAANGGHDETAIPMFAWGDDADSFAFANLPGAVKFSFRYVCATEVMFSFTSAGEKISGLFPLTGLDGAASAVSWNASDTATDSEKSLVFYADVKNSTVSFYLPYPAGTLAAGSQIRLWDATDNTLLYEHGSLGTITVSKNQITVLPAIELTPVPHTVKARVNFDMYPTTGWTEGFDAWTVDRISGFTPTPDPETDIYGGWTIRNLGAGDFFRVEKDGGRWWLVDPLGNIFLSKGVSSFMPNFSTRGLARRDELFGSQDGWGQQETDFLKQTGFNSLGAWSSPDIMHKAQLMPYTILLEPMKLYNEALKKSGKETNGYILAGWEGYPYDFAMVFDPDFDTMLEDVISEAAKYKDDKYLIGYFIDNELPWKEKALRTCLTRWPADHQNHIMAQAWLDKRKGKTNASLDEVSEDDSRAFIAYCYEVYLQKVTKALKKYDPNHLFLGNRFCQWDQELQNDDMFEVAGRYVDAISINFYRKWQPEQATMSSWASWSGKPILVTEFYVKGEDALQQEGSGLTNLSGAGWVVPTQNDRGLFYQNFVIQLLKSDACIGWHWFRYQDNDPEDSTADPSNRNSNKGIVTWDYKHYDDLVRHMQAINGCSYGLTQFYLQ